MSRFLAALALALSFPAAAQQDKFVLQLNWFQLADHSPIYMAIKKGYYKDEGLDLTVLRGAGSADSAPRRDSRPTPHVRPIARRRSTSSRPTSASRTRRP